MEEWLGLGEVWLYLVSIKANKKEDICKKRNRRKSLTFSLFFNTCLASDRLD